MGKNLAWMGGAVGPALYTPSPASAGLEPERTGRAAQAGAVLGKSLPAFLLMLWPLAVLIWLFVLCVLTQVHR